MSGLRREDEDVPKYALYSISHVSKGKSLG